MSKRARYEIVAADREHIALIDLDDGMSVTNDAENVVFDLALKGLLSRSKVILYRDTEGRWDQLLFNRYGHFTGFRAIGAPTREAALKAVKDESE